MNILKKYIPPYAVPYLLAVIAVNCLAYYGSRLAMLGRHYYDFTTSLDAAIPLLPGMVVFYVGAYLQWVLCYLAIARLNPRRARQLYRADVLSKLLCMLCFFLLPTAMQRPALNGSGFCLGLLRLVYRMDAPNNLFPSIHCLLSTYCALAICPEQRLPRWLRLGCLLFSLLVCLSTVLVKQHLLADVPAGILLAIGCYALMGRFPKK